MTLNLSDILENWIPWAAGALALAIIFLFIFFKLKKLLKRIFSRPKLRGLDKKEIKRRWQEIESVLEQKSEMSSKLAVLEADKLLDHVLKSMGFGGSTLAERMRVAGYKFGKLRNAWWPHKIRNEIAHQSNYRVDYRTAKKAVRAFRESLEELGVL